MTQLDSTAAPGLWPTRTQLLALKIALGPADDARAAFDEWLRCVDFDGDFDRGTYRLLPLMYDALRRLRVEHPVMHRLKGTYRRTWYENTKLVHQTRPVIEALRAAGIPLMLTKGAPLVAQYYRNVALRPMADIDIVVPPSRAREALRIVGRFLHDPDGFPSDDWLRFHHASSFESAGRGELDLHWHALPYCVGPHDDDLLWRTAIPFRFGDIDCLTLDPTRMLFHTAIHGLRWNEESPIRWIADAMWVLRAAGHEIDWAALADQADAMQLSDRLHRALAYLKAELGAPIDADVLERLARRRPSLLERLERRIVLRDATRLEGSPLGHLWICFGHYCRVARHEPPLKFAVGFTHYMRFRWRLRGRSEMIGYVLRGSAKRVRRWLRPTPAQAAETRAAD